MVKSKTHRYMFIKRAGDINSKIPLSEHVSLQFFCHTNLIYSIAGSLSNVLPNFFLIDSTCVRNLVPNSRKKKECPDCLHLPSTSLCMRTVPRNVNYSTTFREEQTKSSTSEALQHFTGKLGLELVCHVQQNP